MKYHLQQLARLYDLLNKQAANGEKTGNVHAPRVVIWNVAALKKLLCMFFSWLKREISHNLWITGVAMQGSLLQRNVHIAPHWITVCKSHEVEAIQISLDGKIKKESIEYT